MTTVFRNISQCLTMAGVAKKEGRNPKELDLTIIQNAAIAVDDNNIIKWIGKDSELPKEYQTGTKESKIPEKEIWLPSLVECHTHLIFAGDRAQDYAQRASGKTYQDIAKQGGGILTTLRHTREASLQELVEKGLEDVKKFEEKGTAVVEIKSGYGLSLESELKILEAIQLLQPKTKLKLISTFMPAHATPPEFKGKTNEYVEMIVKEWIPEVAKRKWATFFDVFIEEGFFSLAQTRLLCERAQEFGFKIKLHTDQFTDQGGALLGIGLGATSLDHLEMIKEENIKKLAASNTVAVLCPGASLYTGYAYPPARKLIDSGARVALSTDYNPGTCPSTNLPLMTTLACSQMKMTVPEAITSITYNAACALGIEKDFGSLEVGKKFSVARLKSESFNSLPQQFGESNFFLES